MTLATVAQIGSPNDYMAHDSIAKEGRSAVEGAVDELIRDHKLSRLMLQLERADGGDGDDPLHAKFFHGEDIGSEIQLAGQDTMTAAVACQEGHSPPFQFAGYKYV